MAQPADVVKPVPHREACYIIPSLVRWLQRHQAGFIPYRDHRSACGCAECELLREADAWIEDLTEDIDGSQPPWEREEAP